MGTWFHGELNVFENAQGEEVHFHFHQRNVHFSKCARIGQFLEMRSPLDSLTGVISRVKTTELGDEGERPLRTAFSPAIPCERPLPAWGCCSEPRLRSFEQTNHGF